MSSWRAASKPAGIIRWPRSASSHSWRASSRPAPPAAQPLTTKTLRRLAWHPTEMRMNTCHDVMRPNRWS
jgi:hypothetical protein